MKMTNDEIRLILSGLVYDFIITGQNRSEKWFYPEDFAVCDDKPKFPKGKRIKVTVEWDESNCSSGGSGK